MYEKLKEMYCATPSRLNESQLEMAVKKKWITVLQAQEIKNFKGENAN